MSNQSMYAMYVIGQVESNHNWSAVNYNDPITLGMMQWYGTRAYGLLHRGITDDPDGWAAFKTAAPTLAAQVEANNINWTARYVTRAEGNAWVTWSQRNENHVMQQNQWNDDYNSYAKICDNNGFPAANQRERVYFMCMYHQSPQRAFNVLKTTSATATLELLHSASLNDSVLGQYRNRYNTAYDLLKNWDGQSAPPNFGQVGEVDDTPGGDSGGAITPTRASTMWIQLTGDNLYLIDDTETRKLFVKSSADTWVYSAKAGAPIEGGQTGGGSTSDDKAADRKKVVDLYASWEGKFAYSQGSGRLDPLKSGYGDCSSTIWRAYMDALGIDVGTWTGAMVGKGTLIASGSKSAGAADALAKALPADLLLMCWTRVKPEQDHVELIVGDGRVLSHGGPGNGPVYKDALSQMGAAVEWQIRRYI